MVVVKSLRPTKEYTLESFSDDGFFINRLKFLFNHHDFINYMVIGEKKNLRMLRYVTLNQPYDDPFMFSVILRPIRYEIDILEWIQKYKWVSLNHLPYGTREIGSLYNFPIIKSEHLVTETPFCAEELQENVPCLSLVESCLKLGLEYDSHVVIVDKLTVLVKFRLKTIFHDDFGLKKLATVNEQYKEFLSPAEYINQERSGT